MRRQRPHVDFYDHKSAGVLLRNAASPQFTYPCKICYNHRMKPTPDYTCIYADDTIVVLNKRSGLLIAADRYDAEAPRLDVNAEKEFGRLYAVHRIDKDTSGCVIYARTAEAHRALSMQFEQREVEKVYHCLVYGRPLWQSKHIDQKLLADGDARHRTVPNARYGKDAVTDFALLGVAGGYSWLEARPRTGRTHQIRAHLKGLGLSIVCDPLYSANQKPVRLSEIKRSWRGDAESERPLLARLALHAYRLTVTHPASGERLTFTAPYPKDMEATRKQLASIFGTDPLDAEPRDENPLTEAQA